MGVVAVLVWSTFLFFSFFKQNLFLISVLLWVRDSQRNEVIPSDSKRLQVIGGFFTGLLPFL